MIGTIDIALLLVIILALAGLMRLWPRVTTHPRWSLAGLALVLLIGLTHQLLFRTIAEDGFITFRYALNLALGNGPVFNPGERVEGYSDFLWMVLLAGLHALAGAPIPLTARILGVIAALATIALTYRMSLDLNEGDRRTSLLAALFAASSGSFVAHGPGGMETTLFALLVMLTLLSSLRGAGLLAGLLAALATMTRPEGVLLLPPILFWGWRGPPTSLLAHLRTASVRLLPFLALVLPWTLWRVWYYGYLIPNAVYAKGGMDLSQQTHLGALNFSEFALANAHVLILFIIIAIALTRRNVHIPPATWLLISWVVLHIAFVIGVGGDWMPAWRYFAPVIPTVCVALFNLWATNTRNVRLNISLPRHALILFAFSGLLVLESFFHPSMIPRTRLLALQVGQFSAMGTWFHQTLPAGTLLAVYANGSLSYYAGVEHPVIDLMGLTDEHIAREGNRSFKRAPWLGAQDYAYVLSRRPAVIVFGGGGFAAPSCAVQRSFQPAYVGATFRFLHTDTSNPYAGDPPRQHANLLLLRSEQEQLGRWLTRSPEVEPSLCPPTPPPVTPHFPFPPMPDPTPTTGGE
ncbi:MAG: hypothetical protein HC884_03210 [Chloroflexaceae bacterium]|nr:hypothetical protein [Chloroflexaceae bacterium]